MTITLSPETQKMLEERMKLNGITNPDEALRSALEEAEQNAARNPETLAAITEGIADLDEGRSRPWEEVKKDLIARRALR